MTNAPEDQNAPVDFSTFSLSEFIPYLKQPQNQTPAEIARVLAFSDSKQGLRGREAVMGFLVKDEEKGLTGLRNRLYEALSEDDKNIVSAVRAFRVKDPAPEDVARLSKTVLEGVLLQMRGDAWPVLAVLSPEVRKDLTNNHDLRYFRDRSAEPMRDQVAYLVKHSFHAKDYPFAALRFSPAALAEWCTREGSEYDNSSYHNKRVLEFLNAQPEDVRAAIVEILAENVGRYSAIRGVTAIASDDWEHLKARMREYPTLKDVVNHRDAFKQECFKKMEELHGRSLSEEAKEEIFYDLVVRGNSYWNPDTYLSPERGMHKEAEHYSTYVRDTASWHKCGGLAGVEISYKESQLDVVNVPKDDRLRKELRELKEKLKTACEQEQPIREMLSGGIDGIEGSDISVRLDIKGSYHSYVDDANREAAIDLALEAFNKDQTAETAYSRKQIETLYDVYLEQYPDATPRSSIAAFEAAQWAENPRAAATRQLGGISEKLDAQYGVTEKCEAALGAAKEAAKALGYDGLQVALYDTNDRIPHNGEQVNKKILEEYAAAAQTQGTGLIGVFNKGFFSQR